MQTKVSLRPLLVLLAILLALATPALVRAQFQPPTDEELKMTAEPKAPGAAAIYLYREEATDDALHYHLLYERIKILTEKGKEQATIHIPYYRTDFKVTDIKGRTIHADGAIVPLTAKPSDLVDFKNGAHQVNEMVFTLPDAEVGSILEYRLELRYEDNWVIPPSWDVQQPLYVRKAHYHFVPSHSGYLSDSEGRPLTRLTYLAVGFPETDIVSDNMGRYTLDKSDIPPIPHEDWMPPLNSLTWRVNFYYTYAFNAKDYWMSEQKSWAKKAERFTNPSGQLKQAAAQLVSASDTDEQKARKIYAAVMKLDNTTFSRTKSDSERRAEKLKPIRNAEDVWAQKSGNDDNIALLYVALARAAGLKAWPVEVVDRSRAMFDIGNLRSDQLDDYLAIIELNGKELTLDPGQKMCSFGHVAWKHTYASGFRFSDKGADFTTIQPEPYTSAATMRYADLTLGEDGSVKGSVRYVMTGPEALRWRQSALLNDADEVKKQFNESLHGELPDGVEVDFNHFLALDDPDTKLIAIVDASGTIATATGKHLIIPGLFFESHARHPFTADDKRTVPIDMHYASQVQDSVTYHLPASFSVESAPQATTLSLPNRAILKIASATTGHDVTIGRNFARNFALLDPKDYSELHDFYQKIDTADQQQLVLTRTVTAAGN